MESEAPSSTYFGMSLCVCVCERVSKHQPTFAAQPPPLPSSGRRARLRTTPRLCGSPGPRRGHVHTGGNAQSRLVSRSAVVWEIPDPNRVSLRSREVQPSVSHTHTDAEWISLLPDRQGPFAAAGRNSSSCPTFVPRTSHHGLLICQAKGW